MTTTPVRQEPARLLIADDDLLVREGVAGILMTAADLTIAAQAVDGREAVELTEAHRLDAVLLDIRMPRMDGIGALREIARRRPGLPVAMLTTFSDEHYIADSIRAGALGFLLKSDEPQNLIGSVRGLTQGGGAFSPRVAKWLAARERSNPSRSREREVLEKLTGRQRELLVHVGRGESNAQIASRLKLSEGTVKQYLSSLLAALGVDNRVHAAVFAYRAGLLE